MHVDVIFTHNSTQYLNVLGITNLNEKLATTLLNIACKNSITVLFHPSQMSP
jgi:P pilus assembly chaperone PapD